MKHGSQNQCLMAMSFMICQYHCHSRSLQIASFKASIISNQYQLWFIIIDNQYRQILQSEIDGLADMYRAYHGSELHVSNEGKLLHIKVKFIPMSVLDFYKRLKFYGKLR